MTRLFICLPLLLVTNTGAAYFNWGSKDDIDTSVEKTTSGESTQQPSNLGCFLCTQLLSVTKHRVGLSQNQLRSALYEKCRMLPTVFKDQCFTFVETSLPEIYFSLNYDFSTKDICVRLNLCDEKNPFAVGGPLPEEVPEEEVVDEQTTTTRRTTTTTEEEEEPFVSYETTTEEPIRRTTSVPREANRDSRDRIGHKNVDREKEIIPKENEFERNLGNIPEDKRVTCYFCEKMLENAKNYAVTTKGDITSFANSACSKMPKGHVADQCYQLADKKIADLAKFVDQQVVEALWCAELNQC